MSPTELIQVKLKHLVASLVAGQFDLIVQKGENGRLTKEEIDTAIKEYGGTLTMPAVEDFHLANAIQIGDSCEYAVEYELWFDHLKSDLTLSVSVNTREESIVIEDIHVM